MKEITTWVVADADREDTFWPSEAMKQRAWMSDASVYEEADRDPTAFWAKLAREGLHWHKEWDAVYSEAPPYFKWFVGGRLNASYNCLDRHVETWRLNKAAIIGLREPLDEMPM